MMFADVQPTGIRKSGAKSSFRLNPNSENTVDRLDLAPRHTSPANCSLFNHFGT